MGQIVLLDGYLGSKIHGTATENSDTDRIKIVIPTKRQIVMGDSVDNRITETRKGEKNTSEDVDTRIVTLKQFMRDCYKGNLYTYDAFQNCVYGAKHPLMFTLFHSQEEFLPVNARAVEGIYHSAIKLSEKSDDHAFFKQASHCIRLMHFMNDYAFFGKDWSYDSLHDDGFMDIVKRVKLGELPRSYVVSLIETMFTDEFRHQMALYDSKPITKESIAKWDHWVYSIYLEVVRGTRTK